NIVSNLLTNALKFSPPEEKVYVGLSIEKSAIKVVVKDNGIGIPESNISHIFSPFYRADNAEMIQGTGLGLPIVKESIEKLNGKIEIDSALNKGTEISVILPQN
ncbi:MAG: ATP-binding protein, partial [Bacteroidota bacterium]|nr:ATP-binding protein [Bacteroidota bacterium]